MRRNPLEWTVLLASLAAVGLLVGYLVVAGVTSSSRGVQLATIVGTGGAGEDGVGWYVPVTVINHGDEAALSVVVEASAMQDGAIETSEVTIDLVPQDGSGVEVVFGFAAAPDGPVQIRIVGFERP